MFSFKKNFSKLIVVLMSFCVLPTTVFSQQASAEFISSILPAKLSSGEQAKDGIQNLFFKDQRLYVSNVWSGLQIVDVSNVQQPKELGAYTTESRTHNCFVQDNRAYLCTELEGIIILDITDPANIRKIGQIKTQGDAQFVVANKPYVYVAEETRGVSIYDITNLNLPSLKATYDTPNWAWGLYLDGKTLYVADKGGGMIILDVSNPNKPNRLGQYPGMRYTRTVQVENDIAYVSDGADGLWIFDVTDKNVPKLLSKITTNGYIYDAFKAGNTVFLANETQKRMDIINVTSLSKPAKEGEYQTDSKVYACWKNDVYVFMAADTKTIIVRHNHPPVITKLDNMTVDENELLAFVPEAYDPDGDAIRFSIENLPEGASFDTLNGAFNWTPTYDQSGIYPEVTIKATEKTDSKLSSSTTFDVTVNHVNRAPSLPDVPDTTVDENKTITFTVPEGSDPDIEDKGKLKYFAENMPEGATFNSELRVFSWTPTYEQSGVYTIDFVVQDPPGLVSRDGATITVNHVDRKPTLAKLKDAVVDENKPLTIQLQGSDPDKEDQDKLSYRAENLPEGAVFNADSAIFNWTPTYDQSGEYKNILFIFTAGNLSDSAYLNITVNHVNRPPVLDPIAEQSVNENDSLTFTITGSDPDVEDTGKLVFAAENLPTGSVFNPETRTFFWKPSFEQSGVYENVSFSITDPSGLSDSKIVKITVIHVNRTPELADIPAQTIDENTPLTITLEGSDPDIEDKGKLVYSAQGLPEGSVLNGPTFSWTPTYDQSGEYNVSFTVSDGQLEVTKATTITVNHVNRPPVLDPVAAQTVNENEHLTFSVTGSDPDKEDAGKFVISAQGLPEGSTFDTLSGAFNWTPTFEQSGQYTVKFVNTDPAGLTAEMDVPITVNHVNRTPEFAAQGAQTVDENTPLSFTLVAATDPDKEDAGKLKYSATGLPEGATFDPATLAFNWTPTYDQSGNYTVTFTVTDGEFSVEQPVSIKVNHVNRPPQLTKIENQTIDENKAWSVKIDYSDPDKEDEGKLTLSVTNLPEGAMFDAAAATISWTPTYDQSGSYPGITVKVSDPAGLSDEFAFDITVNHVNRPPVIDPIPTQTVKENETVTFTAGGADPDKEDEGKLTFSVSNAPEGSTFDAASKTFTWTPTYDQAGKYDVTVEISDGQANTTTTASIMVENVNRPPEISGPAMAEVEAGSPLNISFSGSDPDKDNLSFSLEGAPSGATIGDDGNLTWTPADTQAGTFTFKVVVSDGNAQAAKETTVTVKEKPAPPTPAPVDSTSGNN